MTGPFGMGVLRPSVNPGAVYAAGELQPVVVEVKTSGAANLTFSETVKAGDVGVIVSWNLVGGGAGPTVQSFSGWTPVVVDNVSGTTAGRYAIYKKSLTAGEQTATYVAGASTQSNNNNIGYLIRNGDINKVVGVLNDAASAASFSSNLIGGSDPTGHALWIEGLLQLTTGTISISGSQKDWLMTELQSLTSGSRRYASSFHDGISVSGRPSITYTPATSASARRWAVAVGGCTGADAWSRGAFAVSISNSVLQEFVVPSGVTSLTFDIRGAAGGLHQNAGDGIPVANGGRLTGTLATTPFESLWINVGSRGGDSGNINAEARYNITPGTAGYNGGGTAGTTGQADHMSAGGGGATDIRQGGTAVSNRQAVAGGSGGDGWFYGPGGKGGTTTGGTGTGFGGNMGAGGTSSAGGAGGTGLNGGTTGEAGDVDGTGEGGDGGNIAGTGTTTPGAGGGGGYHGGGGGGGGGANNGGPGGGGSNFAGGNVSGASHTQGYSYWKSTWHGLALLSW